MSGVAACASILAIEDPTFAELEAREGALEGGSPDAAASASREAGAARADGGDAGRGMCTLSSGRVCTACLDTACSSCTGITKNLALRGHPETYSSLDPENDGSKLEDGRLVTAWLSAPFQTLPGEIRITLDEIAHVSSVTVYSVRGEHTRDVKEMSLELIQNEDKIPPGALPQKNASGDISWYPIEPLPDISQLVFRILSTSTDQPPGISEIEICGY